jgi:hypothetical protein
LGLRLQLLFAITFFVNHRASGVADFPSPDDPMLTLFYPTFWSLLSCRATPIARFNIVAIRDRQYGLA